MTQPPLRKHDLWPHQVDAYNFAHSRSASLIAAGMGTGKSAVAIALSDNLRCRRTLILCPTTVRSVWRREIAKHSARDVEAVILDHGSVERRMLQANQAWWGSKKPVIIVMNYEGAWRPAFRQWCLWKKWELIVLDESQKVMRESKTALFCNELGRVAAKRLCLTGTPLTQDPISVWAQCRFLDPTVFGDDLEVFKQHFHSHWAVACRKALAKLNEIWMRPNKWSPNPHPWKFPEWTMEGTINTEEYLERLSRVAFRVENVVLDLPPLTVERRTFKLSDSSRRIYEQIKHGYGQEIATGQWPVLRTSFSIVMRLQQITSGWLPDREGNLVPIDSGKAECLTDILSEAGGEPVVVFTRFVRDLDTVASIATKLNLRYGEISQRRKDGLSDMGTMPEWCQVDGVQEQAGGAGIDLTRARIAVFYSLAWSLADYDQALARVYRPPQPKDRPVVIYQLVAEDSIDEELYRALQARREIISQTWRALETTTPPSPAPADGTRHYPSSDGP